MDVISRVGYLKDSDEQLVSGIDKNHHNTIVVIVTSIRNLINQWFVKSWKLHVDNHKIQHVTFFNICCIMEE